LLLKEKEEFTITKTRGISSVIVVISLGIITLKYRKKASSMVNEQANYVEEDTIIRGSTTLSVQQGLGENQENVWYLDSRARNYKYG